jgi:hypothetical protein
MATKRVKNPESLDAIDIALARSVDSVEARALLEKQARLIDSQETLARADLRHRGWQIIGERVAALLKALAVIVGLFLLLLVILFFWSAKQASGMVMDPFSVPPAMDRQGLTGSVVAQQLLDKIAALESGTQSARASSSYENSWGDSKGVAVPYTGVSLGELRREARDWLGSERHLSGEVVQLGDGRLAISFRTGGASGRVEGNERDNDALMDEAAKAIFKATQPYRHSIWLSRNGGHVEELREIYSQLLRSPEPRERLWALHGLALNVAATDAERVALYRRVLALQPDFLPAIGNLPAYALNAGREEEAYHLGVDSAAAYAAGQADYAPAHAKGYALAARAQVAELKRDRLAAAKLWTEAIEHSADRLNMLWRPFAAAVAWAQVHDFAAAKAQLAAAGYMDRGRRAEAEGMVGKQESLRLLAAYANGDFAAQAEELTALMVAYRRDADAATDAASRTGYLQAVSDLRPVLATALARSGRTADAAAVIAPMPVDHDAALRTRALVAAYAGKVAESDAQFARAAARTPSLPAAQMLWAESKLHRRDFTGAEERARVAAALAPNSAEALRLWGDALLGQRRAGEAAEKYARAVKHAPQWGQLHLQWAAALWQVGERDEAIAALRPVPQMALNASDVTRYRRMAAGANTWLANRRRANG